MFSGVMNVNDPYVKVIHSGEKCSCGRITYHGLGNLRRRTDRIVDSSTPNTAQPPKDDAKFPIASTTNDKTYEGAEHKHLATENQNEDTHDGNSK